jgi:hypothetical protein
MYIIQDEMEGMIPGEYLHQALDDNTDGHDDAWIWDKVLRQAEERVHMHLAQRYTTPLPSPYPDIVLYAVKVFSAEALYLRRGMSGDSNPWTKRAEALDKKLSAIGNGEEPLTPEIPREQPSATIVTERSKTFSKGGYLAA